MRRKGSFHQDQVKIVLRRQDSKGEATIPQTQEISQTFHEVIPRIFRCADVTLHGKCLFGNHLQSEWVRFAEFDALIARSVPQGRAHHVADSRLLAAGADGRI